MSEQKTKLSIITPAFNPSQIEVDMYCTCIKQIRATIGQLYDLSFIVVDDGSTNEIVLPKAFVENITVIRHETNRGKGEAVKTGIKNIQITDIVVYTDFDFPYILENLYDMVSLVEHKKAEIVVAKRSKFYFSKLPIQRKIISKLLLFVNRYLMGIQHYDTQGGLKAVHVKQVGYLLSTKSTGFLFEIEFIYGAQKAGVNIVDYEVALREDVLIPSISWESIIKNIRALFVILLNRKD